ncbi:MAG: hypothetical protein FJ276_36015 [Planctomycetes bacterium]|nr:hypothetical protein [Planctomycetota bacterium]
MAQIATAPIALAAVGAGDRAETLAPSPSMPQVRLGEHSISRLICGDNPFKANSHEPAENADLVRRYGA